MKYLRIDIEGCVQGCCDSPLYAGLSDPPYTEDQLLQIGQDMVNEVHSWGHSVVDEDEVPERDR